MREIKLRGYAVDEMCGSQWVFGTGVHTTLFTKEFAEEVGKSGETFIFTESGWIEVFLESVGQYTGLTDKNGTPIYEKDIVDYGAFDLSVIKYEDGAFWARLGQYPMHVIGEYEVKGNLYEHPHLLEVQQ